MFAKNVKGAQVIYLLKLTVLNEMIGVDKRIIFKIKNWRASYTIYYKMTSCRKIY